MNFRLPQRAPGIRPELSPSIVQRIPANFAPGRQVDVAGMRKIIAGDMRSYSRAATPNAAVNAYIANGTIRQDPHPFNLKKKFPVIPGRFSVLSGSRGADIGMPSLRDASREWNAGPSNNFTPDPQNPDRRCAEEEKIEPSVIFGVKFYLNLAAEGGRAGVDFQSLHYSDELLTELEESTGASYLSLISDNSLQSKSAANNFVIFSSIKYARSISLFLQKIAAEHREMFAEDGATPAFSRFIAPGVSAVYGYGSFSYLIGKAGAEALAECAQEGDPDPDKIAEKMKIYLARHGRNPSLPYLPIWSFIDPFTGEDVEPPLHEETLHVIHPLNLGEPEDNCMGWDIYRNPTAPDRKE